MSSLDDRQILVLARKCALLEGFADGCAYGSDDEDWLDKQLEEPRFRSAYINALHERIYELEQQLRADQIERAKKAVLLGE